VPTQAPEYLPEQASPVRVGAKLVPVPDRPRAISRIESRPTPISFASQGSEYASQPEPYRTGDLLPMIGANGKCHNGLRTTSQIWQSPVEIAKFPPVVNASRPKVVSMSAIAL